MAHKTSVELFALISDAKEKVKVGGIYFHYKHPEQLYTLMDVIIIEETDTAGVLYRAEYDELKGIVFMRPIEGFLAQVEVEGKLVNRFTLVE